MKVKVNRKKPFTWSPTSIKTFKTCQLKAWGTWWTPTPPAYEETPATIYGNRVHSALESAVRDAVSLPADLQHLNKWVQSVNNLPGDKICEGKFAFNRLWQRTDYFAKDAWGRMIVDLRIQTSPVSVSVFDWKTGKSRYDNNDQIELGLIAAKAISPDTQDFNGAYIYTKEDKVGPMVKVDSQGVEQLKAKFEADIKVMSDAHTTGYFEPTHNGLCRQYCSVTECPFHGK